MNDFAKGFAVALLTVAGVSWATDKPNLNAFPGRQMDHPMMVDGGGVPSEMHLGERVYVMAICHYKDGRTNEIVPITNADVITR